MQPEFWNFYDISTNFLIGLVENSVSLIKLDRYEMMEIIARKNMRKWIKISLLVQTLESIVTNFRACHVLPIHDNGMNI